MTLTLNTDTTPYVTFLKVLLAVSDLKSSNELQVLEYLVYNASGTRTSLTTAARKNLMTSLGISKQGLSNILAGLKDKQIISGEGGEYELHKDLLVSGTRSSITIKLKHD